MTKLLEENFITSSYIDSEEGIAFCDNISIETLEKVGELLNIHDITSYLSFETPITIELDTPEEHREGCIRGTMYGDGVSRNVAENIVDDVEMTDEEFESLNND